MRIGFVSWLAIAASTQAAARPLALAGVAILFATSSATAAEEVQKPINDRFQQATGEEVPDFQKHVSPLFGRLGCNGRSCHGSFQGRGEFRLSLFGYDFKADHEALMDAKRPRVSVEKIDESLILAKPTDADYHEGGERYKKGSWQHHVLRRWIAGGAKYDVKDVQKLVTLEVSPQEIQFTKAGDSVQLRAIAVWPNGMKEDVTPLCRFTTNNEQVAKITENGKVTANEAGDTHVVISYDNAVVPIPVIRPVSPLAGKAYPKVSTPTQIDKLVVQKLQKLGVVPSAVAGDAEFLRRVSLDLTGTLPSAAEVEAFLTDKSPNKRAEKVEQLLESPAYAAWWTTKLCDFTGNNETQLNNVSPIRAAPSQEWYDWIYKRVTENTPYDQIAEGIVLGQSRKPGQDYKTYCEEMSVLYKGDSKESFAERPSMPYYWARNNYRMPEERAIGMAYTFLGIRIQCAQCHKHPFDQWSKDDFDAFKAFFGRVQFSQTASRDKESQDQYKEIMAGTGLDKDLKGNDLRRQLPDLLKAGKVIPFGEVYVLKPTAAPQRTRETGNNKNRPAPAGPTARVLGGEAIDLNGVEDARVPLMDWMRSKDNPFFAKAFVNRVWANYFNVGIVEPPDDMSLANPPSNRPLLDYLAQGFLDHEFDMKWLHREIIASETYQRTWQPTETNGKDERNFARAIPRRLPAEVAYDAITMATLSDAKASQARSEIKGRAISIASSSARAQGNGNASANATFGLQVFGRSTRESNCDCDRSMDASLLQTVFLQNDSQVLQAISGGRDTWIDQIKVSAKKLKDGSDVKLEDLEKEFTRMKVRLDRAKKDKDEEQVKRIEERLAELKRAGKEKEEVAANPEGVNVDPATLVKQVYLRTVSRYPTDDEMARCQQFLAASSSPLEGAKGLLWTLINTKEFIVNH